MHRGNRTSETSAHFWNHPIASERNNAKCHAKFFKERLEAKRLRWRVVFRSREEPGPLNWPRLCQQSLNTTLLFAARDHARVGTYQANGAGDPFMACPKRFGERCGQILTSAANPS